MLLGLDIVGTTGYVALLMTLLRTTAASKLLKPPDVGFPWRIP